MQSHILKFVLRIFEIKNLEYAENASLKNAAILFIVSNDNVTHFQCQFSSVVKCN